MKTLPPLLAVLLAACTDTELPPLPTTTTAPEESTGILIERGILVSRDAVPVRLRASGMLLHMAEHGSRVAKGDRLFETDANEAERKRDNVETDISELELEEARLLIDLDERRQLEAIEAERLAMEQKQAQAEYDKATSGIDERQSRLLDIACELAALEVAAQESERDRLQQLRRQGLISELILEEQNRRLAVEHLRAQEAATERDEQTKPLRPEELAVYRAQLDNIKHSHARHAEAAKRRISEIESSLDVVRKRLRRLRTEHNHHQEEMDHAAIFAPCDGIFLVNVYQDRSASKKWQRYQPGNQVWWSDTLGNIIDPARMRIRCLINAADRHLLSAGMPVTVRMPAFPGKEFPGTLSSIGGIARDRYEVALEGTENRSTGVAVFVAWVDLDACDNAFRPGMSAYVHIDTAHIDTAHVDTTPAESGS